jgi:hypothetical protein
MAENKLEKMEQMHREDNAARLHDLEAALKKYGVTVVKKNFEDTGGVLQVRVPKDVAQHWPLFIENAYRAAEHHKWALDLSKYFYLDPSTNAVRYLWRLVIRASSTKKLTTAFSDLRQSMIAAVAASVDVMERPLIGNSSYPGSEYKGAHSDKERDNLVARLGNGGR